MARRSRNRPTPTTPPASHLRRYAILGVAILIMAGMIGGFVLFSRPKPPQENPHSTHPTPFSQPELRHTLDHGDFTSPRFRATAGEVLFLHTQQAGGSHPVVTAFDLQSGKERGTFETSARLVCLAISPDEKTLAVAEGDGGIDLATAADLAPTHVLPGHTVTPADLRFSPDSSHLASVAAGEDATAAVWDQANAKEILRTPTLEQPPSQIAWLPNGRQVLIWGKTNSALLWDVATRKELRRFLHPGGVHCAAVTPDGRYLLLGAGGVDFYNPETGELVKRQEDQDHAWPHPLAVSENSQWAAEAIPNERAIRVWRLNPIEVATVFHQPAATTNLQFSGDSAYLMARAQDGSVQLFDMSDFTEIVKLAGPAGREGSAILSPNGRWLVATGQGGAKIWQFAKAP